MVHIAATLISLALLASQAAAHGVVEWFIANGKNYTGDDEFDPKGIPTAIRTVNGNGPVVDVTSPYTACGNQAKVVSVEAPVDAGSIVEIRWSSTWPHNTGAMTAWMAECGGMNCTQFQDLASAQWFKIDEKGIDPTTGDWYMAEIFMDPGKPYNLTIPENLKAGQYLLRHELINLALVANMGGSGAEMYPQCLQLSVQSNGDLVPQSSDYVHFPGAYKATDPGLTFAPGDGQKSQYQPPGGPLAKLVSSSGDASGTDGNAASSTSSMAPSNASSTNVAGNTQQSTAVPSSTGSLSAASDIPTNTCSGDMKNRRKVGREELRGRTLRGRRVRLLR
ncbi:glycosyl hydrolase family 61-domain-containing protein [Dichomitus squalens]|uniref:AA9 family lytic polysaccharide monooxygenase n=1 Tax=Dichomitus squalens TaxID=114155 RepID=A0A4Q9PF92_9APHY|nr:glycosyl hydrolase family 61-domain-containing protein [Dichomitus squalens]TBU53468.1 glycosyl hydrolase family 61-domain-containing protein [Dichomitus squalens]